MSRALLLTLLCLPLAMAAGQTNVTVRLERIESDLEIFGQRYTRWTVWAENTTTNRLDVAGVVLFAKAQRLPPVPGAPPRGPGAEPRVIGWSWNDAFLDRGHTCSCLRTTDLQAAGQAELIFDGRTIVTKGGPPRKGYAYLDPKESVPVGEWFTVGAETLAPVIGACASEVLGPDGKPL